MIKVIALCIGPIDIVLIDSEIIVRSVKRLRPGTPVNGPLSVDQVLLFDQVNLLPLQIGRLVTDLLERLLLIDHVDVAVGQVSERIASHLVALPLALYKYTHES